MRLKAESNRMFDNVVSFYYLLKNKLLKSGEENVRTPLFKAEHFKARESWGEFACSRGFLGWM